MLDIYQNNIYIVVYSPLGSTIESCTDDGPMAQQEEIIVTVWGTEWLIHLRALRTLCLCVGSRGWIMPLQEGDHDRR